MMRFIKNNPQDFKHGTYIHAFLIATMKLIGGALTEFISIAMVLHSDNIEDVVKDFIALIIITQVDDLMVLTMSNINISDEIQNAMSNLVYRKIDKYAKDGDRFERWRVLKDKDGKDFFSSFEIL